MVTTDLQLNVRPPPLSSRSRPLRVLYSFAHRIGAGRICTTGWHQAAGAARAGAEIIVLTGSVARPLPATITVHRTLAFGRFALPWRILGVDRMCRWHDWRTARWLRRHGRHVDVVHAWPLSSLKTLRTARKLGIATVLERPNANTAYAYQAVAEETRRLGLKLSRGSEHVFNGSRLQREEAEYAAADFLLCPSDFVARTFTDRGFPADKLLRHQYGFDDTRFHDRGRVANTSGGLVALYAGICHPRKGLHHALSAWLASGAHERGRFLICGDFVPAYRERLNSLLAHPSIEILGHQKDMPAIMRQADIFVLPTVEEGSALVTYEARACGNVLAVSDASGAVCEHLHDALVHPVGDVQQLTTHLALLDQDRALLERLRAQSLATVDRLTWNHAARRLVELYQLAHASAEAHRPVTLATIA